MSEFTDWLGSDDGTVTPGGAPAATALPPEANPIIQQLTPDPSPALKAKIPTNPDENANNRITAAKLNLPIETVEANPKNAANQAKENDVLKLLASSPTTADFLSDPENAGLAHDSAEPLSKMENILTRRGVATPDDTWLQSLEKTVKNAYPKAKQTVGGIIQGIGELPPGPGTGLGLDPNDPMYQDAIASFQPENSPITKLGRDLYNAATKDIVEPNVPEGSAKQFVSQLSDNFIQMLPTLAATLVTKNPGIGLGVLAAQQGGSTYGESRNIYNQTPDQARARATFFAAAEAIPEGLPLESMITHGKFLPTLMKTTGLEAVGEMFTQLLEDGYDSQTVQPDMTWGQAWDNMKQAGEIGAFMGGAMHVVAHPFVKQTDIKAGAATQMADTVDEMQKEALSAPLTQRAPDKTAEHATQIFIDNGLTQIQMDSQGLSKIAEAKGVDPAQYMVSLGAHSEEAISASALGTDITLPIDKYVNNVFLNPDYKELSPHTRFDPEGLTFAEAQEWKSNGLKQELERVSNSADPHAFNNDQHEITTDHLDILEGAGFTSEAIKGMSPDQVSDLTGISTDKMRTDLPVALATTEMGLQGMFQDAKEAGMTEKQYSTYLEGVQSAKEEARARMQAKEIRASLRQQTTNWKQQLETETAAQKESLSNTPTYSSLNAVQREKLNLEQTKAALPQQVTMENGKKVGQQPTINLSEVEKSHGKLFDKEGTVNPEEHALAHGYSSVEEMVNDWSGAPKLSDAAHAGAISAMNQKYAPLRDAIQRSRDALEAVHSNAQGNVLADEVNALREAKKQGRVNASLLRKAAHTYMLENLAYKDITSSKFLNAAKKLARQAYQALRKGNRTEAADLKYKQLLNFNMAQQAYAQRAKMGKEQKYLKGFLKKKVEGLPETYLNLIKPMLASVQFSGRTNGFIIGDAAAAVRGNKIDWAKEFSKAIDQGNAFIDIPKKLTDQMGKTNWQDLKVEDWNSLVETVKNIETVGKDEDKLRKAGEKATRAQAAVEISEAISTNLGNSKISLGTENTMEKAKTTGRQFAAALLNMDSISFAVDGAKALGKFYSHIKGRVDEAMLHGYNKGQIGYLQRWENESRAMSKLWNMYTQKEQVGLAQKNIKLPGFEQSISKDTMLSVMLNLGNPGNTEALFKSGQITKEQVQAIKDSATDKDIKFVQAVWDYLDEYKPELKEAHTRRTGYSPEMIEGQTVDWGEHGKTRGGYYPIKYDTQKGIAGKSLKENEQDDLTKALEDLKYGRGVASHTARGHMETRTGGDGRLLNLTTAVIHSHVHSVVYDLEMGDAISDAYRILNHPVTRKAFQDAGRQDVFHASNLWLEDQIMKERAPTEMWSRSVRYIRNGYTVSKLGFKTGTAALQLLGLGQSSVHIGYKNMINGVSATIRGQWTGDHSVANRVNEESTFMRHRSHTWSNSITDAATVMDRGLAARVGLRDQAKLVKSAAYYMLLKTQKFVDIVTYMGARQKGLELFSGDQEKSIRYAERMVAQAQGSGSFTDRTAWERGTLGKNVRQNEFVKALTPLISYMMAKNNVAFQRTKATNFRNPGQVLRWTGDMLVLYSAEAIIQSIIYGNLPSGDDDDDTSLPVWFVGQTAATVASGIPIVNGFAQALQGYRAGGSLASTVMEFGEIKQHYDQNGLDEQTLKRVNDILGTAFHYPSSEAYQIYHTIDAAQNDDETLHWYEYVFGPQWNRNK